MSSSPVWSEVRPATLASLLRSRAAEHGERTAFVFLADGEAEGERLTYAGLDSRARAIASALRESLAPGDRALLLYPPGLEFIAAFFGCLSAGVIAVPAYPPRLTQKLGDRSQERLRAIARDAEPKAALTTSPILAAFAESPRVPELAAARWIATDTLEGSAIEMPEPDPESVAFLQYTSGSTATPKGVMVTHANLLHNQRMIGEAFRQDAHSVVVGWLPLYHDMGLIGNVLQPLHAGGSCVLMAPVAFLQKPLRWLQAIHRYRGTTSGGPNFAYELCLRRIGEPEKAGLDLSSWRLAYNGAEPVRAETLSRFAEAFAPCGFRREAFYPCYGLAEATLFVSGGAAGAAPHVAPFEGRPLVSCGHAWEGQRIAIVDPESREELPAGRVGEIWIAGPSVARGYWRNPEATERDFHAQLIRSPSPRPSPQGEGEGPFLRTGDLGLLRGGELYVTGRIKDLVIIRGRNHYPQDIELTAERSHPDLRPGSGAAFSVEVAGEERLVLVQEVERRRREGFEEVTEAVRRAIAEEHEVQVHDVVLVRVGTVPKTSSGKIQRRATRSLYLAGGLEVVGRSALSAETPAVPEILVVPSRDSLAALEPAERRAAVERFLRERAAAAVGVPAAAIDPERPLTALGLDSLAAIELKSSVETAFGVPLPLADLLEGAGTAELAMALLPGLAGESVAGGPVLRAGGAELGEQPLSFGQKALWFLDRLAPEGGAYNVAVAARARGLDVTALRRALTALALRHPALRSVFPELDDLPVRRVLDHPEIDFAVEDAVSWSDARLAERLSDEAYRPFDLGRGPLLRVRAFDRGDGEHALLLAVHHIAVDFASLTVVARDLAALLRGGTELPPLPFGYSDFVRWQDEMLAGPRGERLWEHWREALAGLPDLDLPADRPRPPVQTYRGGARTLELPPVLADGIRRLAAERGATLFMALLAVFQAQLARFAGQTDFAVGSPAAGRPTELAGAVGYFVNPVALRADLAGEPTFAALLDRVRRTTLSGLEHGDFPFALLAERLRPARDPARTPLFQVMFLLQRTRPGDAPGIATFALGESGGRLDLGDIELESLRLEERRAQFDLTLRAAGESAAEEAGGRLRASLEFNADLFDAATSERMLGHFRTLLAGAVEHPDRPVGRLPLLTPVEREQVLVAWNATAADHRRDALLHGLFEEQAARTPDAEALVAGSARLTYAELNHRADELARRLRALGVGPETRVGVKLGRSADLVVSLLGVLKAGGAYVPLDPKYPEERLALMREDSGARLVIDHRTDLTDLTDRRDHPTDRSDRSDHPLPGNLAYLIYTSGSTGRPKAVAIEHRSASLMVQWARRVFAPGELAGVLASTSVAFDLSVFEIFVPLAWGGRVILAENALELPHLPAAGEVALVNTVPSALAELIRGRGLPPSVRTVNLAGEPIPPSLAAAVHGLPGGVRLYNLYGPSEDTTYSTWTLIAPGADVTIGRPIDETRAYVIDARGELLPVGVPGELLLGGGGLARGYLGRPELTAERFVPDPFGPPGERLYRTGDLVRWRADGAYGGGDLEFLGRIDHQVKIRGFRVELGEVEAALSAHPAVREAVVLALPEPGGGQRLAACVVPRDGATAEPAELRAWLQERLPEAFLPTGWNVLDALPLSPNGKVDRKALARLAPRSIADLAQSPESAEPRTPVERDLALLMAETLGVARVGRHDDFFALGGHSLLAARVASRVARRFGVDLPVSALFQAPTVAGLAGRIAAAAAPGLQILPVLRPHEGREDLPLSSAQQRLWFLDRLQPGGAAYNMPGAAELAGALDVEALAAALSEVVRRHEALRTRFVVRGGAPVQVIDPPAPVALETVDLTGLPEAAREAEADARMSAEAAAPFDLSRGPLFRATLLGLAPERHRLLLTLHHIVADGWSLGLLLDELAALYSRHGRRVALPELPVQYADWVVWQRHRLAGEALDRQLAWWTGELAGAPTVLDLPADRPRPAVRTQRGGVVRTWLPAALAEDVRALARQRGATPYMALLAAFQALLGRVAGREDLLVGTVVAGRTRPEVEGLIGFFANTLVMRGDLAGDPSFLDLLDRARQRTAGAWAHQDLPVERLVEALVPDREPGLTPLFQVVFLLQSAPPALALPGLDVRRLPVASGAAKWDLTLELTEEEDGLAAAWELHRDLFDEPTVERLAAGFASLLAGAVAAPERRLADLPLLAEAELRQLLESRRPRPAPPPSTAPAAFVAPRTPVEEVIAAIWAEVLGVERVGVEDNFFHLGGHSLLAARVVARIAETLGADLPLAAFFEAPTVAGLAGRLSGAGSREEAPPLVPLAQIPRDRPLPLSFAQERLWFIDRLAPGGSAYNLAVAALLEGNLDSAALERSLGEIVRRHEALRTVYGAVDGRPVQIVRPWEAPALERRVLASLEEARAEAARDAGRPFDLAAGPVVRFVLTALGPRDHLLSATFHHIAVDGWSLQVFLRELAELYGAYAVGREPRLPELPVQSADYAVWQREALTGPALARPLAFWREHLAGIEPVELPADGPRTPAALAPARTRPLDLPDALAAGVAAAARACGATPFMVLLAGVYALLARLTGQRDLTVGAPEAARHRLEIEGLIGFFANTLPLRTDLEGDPSFAELAARSRATVLAAHAHGGVPFERLVEELQPERASGRNPLFDVMLAYLSAPPGWTELPGLVLRPIDLPESEAQLDLSFTVHEHAGALAGTVTARGDLFTDATLERMTRWLRTLLEGAVAGPAARLSALPLLIGAERAAVLAAGRTEGATWEPALIHRLFEESARRAPEVPAVEMNGDVLSYGQLNARADRLARHLRALGVGPEVPVAVFLERSPALILTLYAVLKAGGVYLPVDPEYPPSRVELLLADADARVLVSDGDLPEGLAPAGAAILRLDEIDLDDELDDEAGEPAGGPVRLDPRNLAYLLYTSGSTGKPKGVAVAHGTAVAHLRTVIRAYGIGVGDRILFFASPSFDISLEEILPGLAVGATIVVRDQAFWEPAELAAKAEALRLTWIDLPTAYWSRWAWELADLETPPAALRIVTTGGEEMLPETARAWRRSALAGVRMLNGYGPTETLVTATVQEVGDGDVTIGRPLPGRSAWVLDADGNLLPDGALGELVLGGVLARGYLGAPDRTAERFVPDAISGEPGARLYRTGDRARRRPGGELEFHGRVDTQVKVRGFRVEPGEIEAVLASHPAVREAAVGVIAESGDPRLAAWVSLHPNSPIENPRSVFRPFLAERLPEWMVPASYAVLPALPLTTHGKIDRRALPKPSFENGAGEGWIAPRSPIEEALAAVWSQVLGIERVGAHDDFFHLGGHSLLATQLAARVRTVLGAELPLSDVFAAPTLAGMAARVEAARSAGRETAPPVVRRPIHRRHAGAVAPLSFAQQRLWFLHQLEPDSPAYHVSGALHLAGPLRPAVLERALNEIVHRHEALRTVFAETDAGVVQRILPPAAMSRRVVPRIDLRSLGGSALRAAEAERLGMAEALRPFDLASGPLLRTLLLRLADEEHLLVVVMHHIASDGWSVGVMTSELVALHAAFAAGEPSPLPELPVQYADFAEWQRRTLSGALLERQLAWWRELLADPPVLDLPADHPRPPVPSGRGGNLPVALPEDLARGLRALARSEGVTLYMVLLAAFATLLGRAGGQEDLTVGSPIAGRDREEIEPLIGCFVNTLVLRVRMAGDPGFRELLARVREVTLGAYDNQGVPFERLVEELEPGRDRARSPLFQVVLVLQNAPQPPFSMGGLELAQRELPTGTAKFDLTLSLAEVEAGIAGTLEHSADLFEAATVARWMGHLAELLRGAVDDPGRALSALPLLGAAGHAQLLAGTAAGGASSVRSSLPRLFAEQVDRAPDAPAISAGDLSLTYRELDERASRLARHLRAVGVRPGDRVALCLDRSPELVIALLAALKTGAAYVPLDPAWPAERLAFALEDSGAALLVDAAFLERLRGSMDRTDPTDRTDPSDCIDPEMPAYVIYTSGSTGRPKGVVVPHGNVSRLFSATAPWFGFSSGDVWTLFHSYAFDFSVWEIWGALLHGGRLVVVPYLTSRDPRAFLRLLEEERVTVLNQTPSAFQQLLQALPDERGEVDLALRQVIFGGEALDPSLLSPWFERRGDARPRLVNMYGITETTVHVTFRPLTRADAAAPGSPIGEPIPDLTLRVVDRHLGLQPWGFPGEICVGGEGLAQAYLGRPELTAERFVPDPWGPPGARLYRSGDLARRRADGALDYLGRIDNQVKIRGFRIEPGEVEAALARHPAVRRAVVLPRDGRGGTILAGYVVPSDPHAASRLLDELPGFLRRSLPEHMVPAAFVALPDLPLTPNGKIDRRALERLRLDPVAGTASAPRTPAEELLAALWCEVLGLERVGVHDSFFDLGGHSLLATRLVARVRATFGRDLPLGLLFETPTIAELARHLDEARGGPARTAPLRPVSRAGDLPLSFAQERLWFLDRIQPGPAYNVPLALRLRGALDAGRLGRAVGAIVARQEALRTVFVERDGEPAQRILNPPESWPLPVVDLAGCAGRADAVAAALAEEDALRPFDLAAGPLLRTTLLRLGAAEHVLVLGLHHIVADGWSLGVLLRELAAFYGGAPEALPDLPVQYADFAVWQKDWLHGEELERQTAYWRRQLAGAPAVLDLPTDRPRPLLATTHGARRPVAVAPALASRLAALGRRQGATPFMLLLAAWVALLHRFSRQEDLNVGTPIAGRNRAEIEPLVGFFVNTLVLRTDLTREEGGDPAFPALVAQIRRTALAAYEHQDLPFEKLVDELRPERDMSHQPLFQVMFALQNAPLGALELPGLTLEPAELGTSLAKLDLTLELVELNGLLAGSLEYNTDLFDGTTAARLAAHWSVLLEGIAAQPERRISELPLLTEGESHQLLVEWSAASPEPRGRLLHALVERHADRTPEAPAVEHGAVRWSYGELESRANRLAWFLRELGVGPETRVALCVERTADMVAAMLGVLKAGGAYVPLDPALPRERLAFMLEDSGARVLLTQERLLDRLPETGASVVCLDRDRDAVARRPATRPASGVAGLCPAYVIYTSGSTGQPKGVLVPHESAAAYSQVCARFYGTRPGDRNLQLASISFDASIEEIYSPLTRGATLVVRGEVQEGITEFLERCRAERITLLQQPTAFWHQLAAAMEAEDLRLPDGLRVIFVGGEKMLAQRLVSWWRLVPPGFRLINAYGPTETTVAATLCPIPDAVAVHAGLREVPIGRPISYVRAYVLDRDLRPVPIGVVGELCLGGIGVSRGYLGRPELTAERFIPNPQAHVWGDPGERLYRTGDLVRLLPDGLLEFIGRTDQQVKIRGYRIELGEIEAALAAHPGLGEVVVLTHPDPAGDLRLAAYGAVKGEVAPAPAELRAWLEERLPAWMVPAEIQVLPALPLNAQGKVDRRALARLAPRSSQSGKRAAFAAPRNQLEASIARVWRDVFGLGGEGKEGVDAIGIHDNFFDAGGSSLLLVKLHSRLQKALGRNFPLVELFKHPTIAALAASLGAEAPAQPSLDKARARTETRRESMRQMQQLREQRRRGR